ERSVVPSSVPTAVFFSIFFFFFLADSSSLLTMPLTAGVAYAGRLTEVRKPSATAIAVILRIVFVLLKRCTRLAGGLYLNSRLQNNTPLNCLLVFASPLQKWKKLLVFRSLTDVQLVINFRSAM